MSWMILNWEVKCSWWLDELMVRPRVMQLGSLLGGNTWRWMVKVLCMPKMRSRCCFTMHSLCRVSRMVVACGSLVVRMMPSIL